MKNPRLIYRVILKLFALSGIAILLYVLFSSLFIKKNQSTSSDKPDNLIKLDLTGMKANEIKKVSWEGKQILVLKQTDTLEYRVFFNTGDSGNCPLYYAANKFKDTCTGTLYDHNGREINQSVAKYLLKPPYHFKGNVLIIGK